jgi:hypothetical protein
LQRFEQAAQDLPLRVEGRAFAQVQKIGESILRATLIDPGFLDPADRAVHVRVRAGLQIDRVMDLLSGESLTIQDRRVAVTVPAGVFRIIEFHGRF